METSAAQAQSTHPLGGFPCPRCRNPIRFPYQDLLAQPAITCPHCGLELEIDLQRSAAALQALRRYANGLEEARHMLEENQPGERQLPDGAG
jgi:hypothetical protein